MLEVEEKRAWFRTQTLVAHQIAFQKRAVAVKRDADGTNWRARIARLRAHARTGPNTIPVAQGVV